MLQPTLPIPANHRNFIWVSISCGLYWFAFSLTRPIITLYAASLGLQGLSIGIVLAVYALLPMLAAIPGGFIADRFGRSTVLRAGSIMMLFSGLLYWISGGPWTLALAQLLAGLGQMAVWLAVQVLITEGPAQGNEGRFATFSLYMAIGQMLAPILSGYLADHYGYKMVFAGYILSSALLIFTSWQCRDEAPSALPSEEGEGTSHLLLRSTFDKIRRWLGQCLGLLRNPSFAVILLTTFISLFIVDVRTAYLPLHLESQGISNTKVGLLVSIGAVSALFVRPIYPRLMARLSFGWMLILTYAVSLLLLFVTPLLTNFYGIAALVFITGLALGINQPLTLSMIAHSTAPEERGLGIGLRLMSNRAAQLMDPLLFGFFTAFVSLQASFLLVGALLLACCVFTIQLHLSAERVPRPPEPYHDKKPRAST
ncbi:MFS transporter [Paenibacillus brevis]|uniref:MFS transporter n=1 Tax=Paenibacillus brevis TaxID=2841508 RepID=A0ABS6FL29_9BACL|nr:MFS transporter [Paenibacillus brevis]MBU5670880.1 MFS transporter [Paenibacillus brevis]